MYLVFTVDIEKEKPRVLYPRFFKTYEEAIKHHIECINDIGISNNPYEWSYIVDISESL